MVTCWVVGLVVSLARSSGHKETEAGGTGVRNQVSAITAQYEFSDMSSMITTCNSILAPSKARSSCFRQLDGHVESSFGSSLVST